MDDLSPPEFAEVVRQLTRAATAAGMRPPAFISPPRTPSARRTIRWLAEDRALIAVRRANRGAEAVVTDMIDGVIAANRLSGAEAQNAARKLAACLTL